MTENRERLRYGVFGLGVAVEVTTAGVEGRAGAAPPA